MRQARNGSAREEPHSPASRFQSAPKGILKLYVLHKIAEKPVHGYELIQDIDSKTEGGWRPGAGSLYPILKKLVRDGYIKAETGTSPATRRTYHVTPEGVKNLAEAKHAFSSFQHRWSNLRNLFIELIDPENVPTFFIEGSKRQFQMAQEILESKAGMIPPAELELALKEYALNLERQLNWTNKTLDQLKPKVAQRTSRQKTAGSAQ